MIWNRPDPSVTVVRTFSISTGLAASTVTPGSTAPELSRTTPEIVAWANAAAGSTARQSRASAPVLNARIFSLLGVAYRAGSDGRMVRRSSRLCQGGNALVAHAYAPRRGFRGTYQWRV
jgi:hypothetical protein